MKNETPDFGKKGPQYGNWIPYSLVMVSLAAALALLFAGNALKNVVGWLSSVLTVFSLGALVYAYYMLRARMALSYMADRCRAMFWTM